MSFKCSITQKTVFNERQNRVVVETRDKVYTDPDGLEIGRGIEIVKEVMVSAEGLRILQERQNQNAA